MGGTKQIVAMGGGGFLMEPDNPLLDQYVLSQVAKPRPTVLFLPTAQGDSHESIAKFHDAFERFDCTPRVLAVFRPSWRRQSENFETAIVSSDVVYVAGGNTRAMLAVWREFGIDAALRKAWERGVMLAGVSAGALCWFEEGHTDSDPRGLARMNCLGFLRGSFSCTFNDDPRRHPSYVDLVRGGKMKAGYGVDTGAALHFVDEKLHKAISSRERARARRFSAEEGGVKESPLVVEYLGS
jgi:dipeptidase E